MTKNTVRQDIIIGSKRFSNYFWTFILFCGGLGFLLAGISSYLDRNLLPFVKTEDLVFLPQGLIMLFYGNIAIGLGLYIFILIFFDVGGGFNEYNKIENVIKIVRKGFPGQNRQILLTYPLENVHSIGIRITEGLNPTRNLFLCLKDKRMIPLTPVRQPTTIAEIEEEAADLAKFLELSLENV